MSGPRLTRRGEAGSLLLENLVAIAILMFGLLAAAPMFIQATKATEVGADVSAAGSAAVDRMELLRAIDYENLVVGGDLASDVTGYADTSDPDVVVRWQVEQINTPVPGKTIRVRAIMQRQVVGRAKQVTLTTRRTP
jgi:Tfp pilus assembly protein PilV